MSWSLSTCLFIIFYIHRDGFYQGSTSNVDPFRKGILTGRNVRTMPQEIEGIGRADDFGSGELDPVRQEDVSYGSGVSRALD